MRKQAVLLIILFIVLSCQSHKGLWNTEANIKKVEKGMTYDQVLSIMSKDYSGTGSWVENDEIRQVLKYNSTGRFTYVLNFTNNILKDWTLEKKPVSSLP